MIIEAIGTGSTIDEARRKAIEELNVDADNYEIELMTEIIDQPEKKVFGLFGGKNAKVRVYYEVEEKKEPVKAPNREPKPAKKAEKPAAKPAAQKKTVEKVEKPVEEVKAEPAVAEKKEIDPAPAQAAEKYLREILAGFDITDVDIKTEFNDDGAVLVLEGENLGIVIGRRGETLDAIQYLIGLVANKVNNSYYRISINTGNYREKRETTIETLAKKTAARALKTGKNIAIEPMNPYERRIIHTTVQEIEGVSSWSMDEDRKRHVVIGPAGVNENQEGELFASFSHNNNRRRNNQRKRYNGKGRNGGQRRYNNNRGGYNRKNNYNNNYSYKNEDNNGVIKDVDRIPTKTTISAPLYGKIDVKKHDE